VSRHGGRSEHQKENDNRSIHELFSSSERSAILDRNIVSLKVNTEDFENLTKPAVRALRMLDAHPPTVIDPDLTLATDSSRVSNIVGSLFMGSCNK
jgi:hypothetical protein